MEVKTNVVFEYLSGSKNRVTVMQGGTRSGKTYNIILFFVILLLQKKGKTLTIVRDSLPSLKGSVMRDFVDILLKMDLYNEADHNKTESTYMLNGNRIEFVSADQPQKIRGRKRDYLFINEANELNYEAWLQLVFRTGEKIVLDYNPSDEYSWIYDHVIPRDDADFFITTYRDNPFLPIEQVDEIERLEAADENYWRIYGLGQRGISQETVYTHWQTIDKFPEGCDEVYGVDFGFNVPSSIIKVGIKEGNVYVHEMLYETKLTTSDMVKRIENMEISKSSVMYCDSADAKAIEEFRRAKYNAKPSDKDVVEGIRKIKSMPLFITESSPNVIKEIRNYKWKVDKDGRTVDEPVKWNDHSMDAIRYAVFTHYVKSNKRMYSVGVS